MIPDFAKDIFAGRDVVILSDGSPKRTFCYATDAITGYYKVLVRGGLGEPYNIGIDRPEISVAQLAEHVVKAASQLVGLQGQGGARPQQRGDYLIDNPNRRCPVIDKARTELGFNPRVLPEEGISRSLIWYSHNQTAVAA